MFEMMGIAAAGWVIAPVIGILFWIPALIYVVARWRTYREGHSDAQLGLKVVMSLFKIVSYQMALGGLFLLVYALMSDAPDETQETVLRTAGGMLLPSIIVYGIHFYAYNRTNHREMPTVDRLFGGVNLLITGLIAFGALIVACQLLFQKKSDAEHARLAWSFVITYSLAWLGQGLLFARLATLPPAVPNGAPAPPPPSTASSPPV